MPRHSLHKQVAELERELVVGETWPNYFQQEEEVLPIGCSAGVQGQVPTHLHQQLGQVQRY